MLGGAIYVSLLLPVERMDDGACALARLSYDVEVERNPWIAIIRLDLRFVLGFVLVPATSLLSGQCFKILTT